jgi:glyoxylase-like metal-dependent hydrolase (beta-lactamase superfamily II)
MNLDHLRAGILAGAMLSITLVLFNTEVSAAAPQGKTLAPGYYHVVLGYFEITALSDGSMMLPVDKLLLNTSPEKVKKTLASAFVNNPVETSVNAYLVNTGSKLILMDAGTGTIFGPTLGKLLANLKASGYRPDQIDEVYLTHLHMDHAGGLLNNDTRTFPNAVVRVHERDVDYWLSKEKMEKAPEERKPGFKGAMRVMGPYQKAGKFVPFKSDVELSPGIKAVSTPGHSVGHNIFVLESKKKKLLVWGDLVHVAAIQFQTPDVAIVWDGDAKQATSQRRKAFMEAEEQGYLAAGAHLPFPGIGHVRKHNQGFEWKPVDYSAMVNN